MADHLNDFANAFFGYGDFSAPIWFIGMEEGGGTSKEEIQSRLDTWTSRNRPPLEDAAEFHDLFSARWKGSKDTRLFENFKTQRTWAKLIRCHLMASGEPAPPSAKTVLEFQRHEWLRHGSKTCGLELLPLPSPRTSCWKYGDFSQCPAFKSRKLYSSHFTPKRIARLISLIDRHKPRAVVFYGKSYDHHWSQIARNPWRDTSGFRMAENGNTVFASMAHPVARGVRNATFEGLGRLLKAKLFN